MDPFKFHLINVISSFQSAQQRFQDEQIHDEDFGILDDDLDDDMANMGDMEMDMGMGINLSDILGGLENAPNPDEQVSR